MLSYSIETYLTGVDRLIHEPSRSVILAILSAVQSADFLYLLRETGLSPKVISPCTYGSREAAGYLRIEKTYRGRAAPHPVLHH